MHQNNIVIVDGNVFIVQAELNVMMIARIFVYQLLGFVCTQ